MKALNTLKSAIDQSHMLAVVALIVIAPLAFPHMVIAAELQTSGQQNPVFKINVTDPSLLNSAPKQNDNQNFAYLDFATLTKSDPLVKGLDAYLEKRKSPLAGDASKIVTFTNWRRAIAISLVESHMCRFTPKVKTKAGWVESHNCSGIGGAKYRMYDSYMGWFSDMDNLLSKPAYVNRPLEKFIGYYVQPGSPSWLRGVKQVEAELAVLEADAKVERQELALNSAGPVFTALATFPNAVVTD